MDFLLHPHFAPLVGVIAAVVVGIGALSRGGAHPEHSRELVVCGLILAALVILLTILTRR